MIEVRRKDDKMSCWNHGENKNYVPTEGGKKVQDNPLTNGKKVSSADLRKKKKKKEKPGMFDKPKGW